ncbi:hypothetical protein NL676_024377 [Syzygium grande]|nr:hypothetical protein NL676_024377 [Syzygium grande]
MFKSKAARTVEEGGGTPAGEEEEVGGAAAFGGEGASSAVRRRVADAGGGDQGTLAASNGAGMDERPGYAVYSRDVLNSSATGFYPTRDEHNSGRDSRRRKPCPSHERSIEKLGFGFSRGPKRAVAGEQAAERREGGEIFCSDGRWLVGRRRWGGGSLLL